MAMENEQELDIFATSAYRIVKDYFDINLYRPTEGNIVFWANPMLHKSGWKRKMNKRLATINARASVSRENNAYRIEIIRGRPAVGFPPTVNTLLFILTFLTVLVMYSFFNEGPAIFSNPVLLAVGLPFAVTLMTILLLHEMGHFIAGYSRGIIMSYPYFIPAPTFFGTFGALIRSRTPIRTRNDLILVGASGPLAGFIPSVIALVYGIMHSNLVPLPDGPALIFGDSLFTRTVQYLILGPVPENMMLNLSSVGFAGYVGLLVTMLNLLPLGQLDGGHIMYGLFGRGQRLLAVAFMAVLFILGFVWKGWWIWLILAMIFKPFHPPVIQREVPVDTRHKVIGWTAVILFILTFIPIPIS